MANYSKKGQTPHCSFCGKDAGLVDRLVAGPGVYICNECVALCNSILEDESGFGPEEASAGGGTRRSRAGGAGQIPLLPPTEMKKTLDDYVIGQEDRKSVV